MKDIFYLIKTILLFLRNKGIIAMLILFLLIWWLFLEPSYCYASEVFDETSGVVVLNDYYKTCVEAAQLKYMYQTVESWSNNSTYLPSPVKDDITYMFNEGDLAFYSYDMSNLFSGFDTENQDYVYAVQMHETATTSSTNVWKPIVGNTNFTSINFNYPGYKILSGEYTRVNPGGSLTNYKHTDNLDGIDAYYPASLRGYYHPVFYEWAVSIYNNTYKNYDANYWFSMIVSNQEETNKKLDDIKNEIKETNDFLKDDSVDDSSMDLPSDNNNDVTSDYFNSIFEKFKTYMTTSSPISIEIPIPFADSGFTIESDITQKMVEGTIIQPLLSSVWFFLVGLYILKDVEQLIDKVKNR